MDIRPYINSKAIAEYFYNEFDEKKDSQGALKYSWLVWESRNKSIDQKHEAWKEIIDTMPDQPIEARRLLSYQDSLHDFLRQYMDTENALRDIFHAEDKNCVYQYEIEEKAARSRFDEVYSTYENCRAAVKEYIGDYGDCPESVLVRKLWLDDDSKQIMLTLSPKDLEEKKIDSYGVIDEDGDEILDGFRAMWFRFPTPFKHGDLLRITYGYYKESLFLLDYLCTDAGFLKNHEYQQEFYWDSSDMTAYGYIISADQAPVYEICPSYLDLEFYDCEYNRFAVEKLRKNFRSNTENNLKNTAMGLEKPIRFELYVKPFLLEKVIKCFGQNIKVSRTKNVPKWMRGFEESIAVEGAAGFCAARKFVLENIQAVQVIKPIELEAAVREAVIDANNRYGETPGSIYAGYHI